MSSQEQNVAQYYERELGWVPPFVRIMARHTPGALDGFVTMRRAILQEPPAGALPRDVKEMLFTILDCVTGEVEGAKAHARAAIDAGLTLDELAEGFVIAIMVTGITTMCKAGVHAFAAAEQHLGEKDSSRE
jgi:alkylhydroperoxidase/carboxymuconolactone decarboxylase family protein YurZ